MNLMMNTIVFAQQDGHPSRCVRCGFADGARHHQIVNMLFNFGKLWNVKEVQTWNHHIRRHRPHLHPHLHPHPYPQPHGHQKII